MARDTRTRTRSGDARLEMAALLLAALTALVAIARSDAISRRLDVSAAIPRAVSVAAPSAELDCAPSAREIEAEAVRQAILRDMLLHD